MLKGMVFMSGVRVGLCGLALVAGASALAAAPAAMSLPAAARALASVPAWFEPNPGLYGPQVRYVSRGAGYALLLEESGAVLRLMDESGSARLRIALAGANPKPVIEALNPLPARTNYLLGNQPARWRANVPHYGRVRYRDAYPGIDVVYLSSGRQLEYDFVISPGADPGRIRLRFRGADQVRLEPDGALVLVMGGREIRQPSPVLYQETAAGRAPVQGRYVLARDHEVCFAIGDYDRRAPLVIDPVLVYAGYFGGSTYEAPTGIAYDRDGSIWITGTTFSTIEFPPQNEPYQSALKGKYDVFIARLSIPPFGAPTLLYYTYFGGTDMDYGGQILVDGEGMVTLTGSTVSFDLPVTSNAFSSQLGGAQNTSNAYNQDAFIARINPAAATGADSLVFSSFMGGSKTEAPTALALAPDGTVLVAGYTSSVDIDPIVSPTLQPNNRGGWDAFFYAIDPYGGAGETLKFNTYFGGASTDIPIGVAAGSSGAIYIAGYTLSEDFPIAGDCYQCALRGAGNVFVARLDLTRSGLDTLVYATYFGGSELDVAEGMRMDASGGIWLAGYTLSPDYPVTANAFRTSYCGGATDAFLTRLDLSLPRDQVVTYSTFFGGGGADVAYDLALLGGGKAALAGYTLSNDLPILGAPPSGVSRKFMADAFVAVLDTSRAGSDALSYSTYFGGGNSDVATRLLAGPQGDLYVIGYTLSKDLPVTDGSTKLSPFGSTSGFLLRLDKIPGEQ
jgi:hypothetical protein